MTLNLMIVAPWGLWLSSDFRTCEVRAHGRLVPRKDVWSPKYATISTSDATLALTYTGAAEATAVRPDFGFPEDQFPDIQRNAGKLETVPVSEWVTWVLYGETRTLDQAVHHIASEASKVRSLLKMHHVFTGVAFAEGKDAWFVQIANIDVLPGEDAANFAWLKRAPRSHYGVSALEIADQHDAFAGAVGTGAHGISKDQWRLLQRVGKRRPRDPDDYMNLLAKINAEVARREACVSPACAVTYLDPQSTASRSRLYENGQSPPSDFLFTTIGNLWGIDLTQQARSGLRQFLGEKTEYEARSQDQTSDAAPEE
jgi:hypothetical protein